LTSNLIVSDFSFPILWKISLQAIGTMPMLGP